MTTKKLYPQTHEQRNTDRRIWMKQNDVKMKIDTLVLTDCGTLSEDGLVANNYSVASKHWSLYDAAW